MKKWEKYKIKYQECVRIMEYPELEGTLKHHQSNPWPCKTSQKSSPVPGSVFQILLGLLISLLY